MVKPFTEKTLNTTIQIALSRHKATVELHTQLAAVLDSSDNAVIGKMLDGTIASWNPGAEKMFGYRASEAIARPISILVPPNCVDEMPQILERIARGEKVEHYETVRMRKDGQLIDVCLTISPIKNATGQVIGVSQIARNLTEEKRNERLHQQQRSLLSNLIEGSNDSIAASQIAKNVTDRIRAEQVLRENEQRFRHAFNYTAVSMAMSSPDGRFFQVNHSFCQMLGYLEAELLTMNFQSITHPDDLDTGLRLIQRLLAGEIDYYKQEKRYLHKQGHSVWAIVSVSLVRDEQGQPLYFIAQAQDISDRIQSEQALCRSSALLKQAQSLARIGNWEFDVSTQKSTWSEEIFRIFGLDSTESEPNYAGVMQLFHPEDGEKYHQLVQRVLAEGTPYDTDLRYFRSDGFLGWLNVRGEAVFDSQGRVIRLLGTAQDITERKQAQERLQQAHQKLTFLIQNTPLAAIEWDSQFRVSSWSQRAEEIFGWKAEEVLGKTMHEWRFIFEEDLDYVNQSASRQLNGTSIYTTCENRNYTKDGSVIDCQWYNSALLDESGNLVSMLSLAHDISDRKQAETACRLSEERLQLSLEGSGDAWWDWDIPSGQVSWSPRLWGMLGYEDDELPKEFSTWERLMHPDDKPRVMELLQAHLQDSSVPYKLEHRLLSKSGEWKWIASYGRVMVRDETGKPLRMSGTHRDINERKQAEEALRTSQEQLQLALEGSDEGWWDWNIVTGEGQFSPRWYTMLGYEAGELLPHSSTWKRLIHPDDRPDLMELLEAHLQDSSVPYQLEYRL
ncbi:MAG TPA: PAS domain S-box protein, partial [Allocoleopsis sp.]